MSLQLKFNPVVVTFLPFLFKKQTSVCYLFYKNFILIAKYIQWSCFGLYIGSKQLILVFSCYTKKEMNYWLLKTDPETYSWDDLVKKGVDMWDGVRNFQARNYLRKIRKGDIIFVYHSGEERGLVGLAEAVKEFYSDPTSNNGDWSVIDVKPVRKLKRFISLAEIKKVPELKNMVLLKNTRLSVQPVFSNEFNIIMKLEKD